MDPEIRLELTNGLLVVHFRYAGKAYAASAALPDDASYAACVEAANNLFRSAQVSLGLLKEGKYDEAVARQPLEIA